MEFNNLMGITLSKIDISEGKDEIIFESIDGRKFKLSHDQECCESVLIEDINGDIQDLIGTPILQAEESISKKREEDGHENCTWTFYKLATIKGHVVIRWLGSSNGYYSESVSFWELEK
jgi:hypothetical protein